LPHQRRHVGSAFQPLRPGGNREGTAPVTIAPAIFIETAFLATLQSFEVAFEVVEKTHYPILTCHPIAATAERDGWIARAVSQFPYTEDIPFDFLPRTCVLSPGAGV